jgi:hypothetical protein
VELFGKSAALFPLLTGGNVMITFFGENFGVFLKKNNVMIQLLKNEQYLKKRKVFEIFLVKIFFKS